MFCPKSRVFTDLPNSSSHEPFLWEGKLIVSHLIHIFYINFINHQSSIYVYVSINSKKCYKYIKLVKCLFLTDYSLEMHRSEDNLFNNPKYVLNKSQKWRNTSACVCECGRKFDNENNRNYHKRFQCGKSLQCNLCRRSYCSIYYVRRHMKTCKMKGSRKGISK